MRKTGITQLVFFAADNARMSHCLGHKVFAVARCCMYFANVILFVILKLMNTEFYVEYEARDQGEIPGDNVRFFSRDILEVVVRGYDAFCRFFTGA
ncbi:MAG: hypothetical protein F8N36_11660 [Desulfovibrio sp.]|nr:hypothetical protein [Desulfovibrio sp.]